MVYTEQAQAAVGRLPFTGAGTATALRDRVGYELTVPARPGGCPYPLGSHWHLEVIFLGATGVKRWLCYLHFRMRLLGRRC